MKNNIMMIRVEDAMKPRKAHFLKPDPEAKPFPYGIIIPKHPRGIPFIYNNKGVTLKYIAQLCDHLLFRGLKGRHYLIHYSFIIDNNGYK